MKQRITMIFCMIFMGSVAFSQEKTGTNPFFTEYTTPFQVPPFDKIDTAHYIPAFLKGIAEQQAEIDKITSNTSPPSFENTVLAYDQSGKLLTKVGSVFYSLNSANTNDGMQDIARKISPLTTQHRDNISLNEKLFSRIKAVYLNRLKWRLEPDQKRLVEKYYDDFVRNGAGLDEAGKAKLRDINQQLSASGLKFGENLLAETNKNFKLTVEKASDLDGLPQDVIDAAAETAKKAGLEGKWVFTLQKPSMLPFLQYAKNRTLREKLYKGYLMRGNNNDQFDNKELILKIANLRSERAKLLGYKTFADYTIANNMAKSTDKVYDFLNQVMDPALKAAEKDKVEMQAIIDKEGGNFKMESWDWWFYAEKLKKEKYDLEESEIKPYFSLNSVKEGMFYTAKKLFDISFTKLDNIPVYHAEVEVFEVKDKDGKHLGILYMDYHPRGGKRVGAWCGSFREQSYENGKRTTPVVTIVTNFTRPNGNTPALLSWDEVNTLFHEFGHGLHGLFTDGRYNRTAGDLARDMVELPSQFMEHYAAEPEVLKIYAKHYKTGELLPEALQEKLMKSLIFNEGFATSEYIAAAILDLDWHSFKEPQKVDVVDFEKQSMKRIKLIKEIEPRYRTTYFNHVIGGYAAGYYVYLWAAVLDSDAFQAFKESGNIFNKEVANKYRKYILTEGGNDEGMVQYAKFRGKAPSVDALLKDRGLN
jgi:peptidyl-dipeptidase Dcp